MNKTAFKSLSSRITHIFYSYSFYLRRSHAGQWVTFGFHLLRKIESLEAVRGQRSMVT